MVRRRGRLRPRAKASGRPPCFPAAMYSRRMSRIATCRPADAVRLLADGFGRGRLKRASLEARKRCRTWPAQIPEAALFRSPYRAARFPLGNRRAARGVPAAGLGSGGHGAANRRRCTAALLGGSKWGGGVAPAEWRVQRMPNGVLSMPGLGRAGPRPAVAGRRAVRRSSAGCHAGRGGRWTAGRTRPPPGFRRRHACTPGRWPRRKRCLLERCRALWRREWCLLVWCRLLAARYSEARYLPVRFRHGSGRRAGGMRAARPMGRSGVFNRRRDSGGGMPVRRGDGPGGMVPAGTVPRTVQPDAVALWGNGSEWRCLWAARYGASCRRHGMVPPIGGTALPGGRGAGAADDGRRERRRLSAAPAGTAPLVGGAARAGNGTAYGLHGIWRHYITPAIAGVRGGGECRRAMSAGME